MSAPHGCPPSVTLFFTFLLLLISPARQSRAIQLHWSSGASDTSFTASTRATLVVQADPSEAGLPGSWRLQWVADSSGIRFVAPDSSAACQTDVAKVSAIDSPSTAADSAANQITAHLCSSGSEIASTAYFVLDLTGGSVGKLKVVALDPTDPDSNTVVSSNEVTYNGGVDGTYAPSILRTTSIHDTRELRVTLVGTGLAASSTLRISAPDRVWSVPLAIVGRTDSILTAAADVPMPLPAAIVEAGSSGDMVSVANFSGDAIVFSSESMPDTVLYRDPNPDVYPKDFAFYEM